MIIDVPNYLNSLPWSAGRFNDNKTQLVQELFDIPAGWWGIWSSKKDEMKAAGVKVAKDGTADRWVITWSRGVDDPAVVDRVREIDRLRKDSDLALVNRPYSKSNYRRMKDRGLSYRQW
jgi:hypothetical protein